jgi:hypothetical protein
MRLFQMPARATSFLWYLAAAAICALPCTLGAKSEKWQDAAGNKFRGEPAEVIGPMALFRTSETGWRMVPLHLLSPDDCVRLNDCLRSVSPRADEWAQAKGEMTRELTGNVLRLENDKLVPTALKGRPEPEFFIVLYASHGEGKSWEMIGNVFPAYQKLQQDFPGMVEALFFGTSDTNSDHVDMAKGMKMPWLIIDFHDRSSIHLLSGFVFDSKYGIVVVNRDGVPLLSSQAETKEAVDKAMGTLHSILEGMRPENIKSWADRLYYFRAVQPAVFKDGHADPVLVGNPLIANGLKQRNVYRFDANIDVAADGTIAAVTLSPGGDLPPKLEAPLAEALRKAVFVPAVDHGKFVAGVFHYHFETAR